MSLLCSLSHNCCGAAYVHYLQFFIHMGLSFGIFYIPPGGSAFELLVWFFLVAAKLVPGNF